MPSMTSSRPAPAGSLDSGNGGRSAAVLEFICLFTHDLRKKQKRWEDGRLRYHTFNKRVMVYDDRGNFVGDLHWTREEEFGEGEEVQLEHGTAIIQVMDCVGRKEQDLSELLDKRAKEKEQRQARLLGCPPLAGPSPTTPVAGPRAQAHFQTRHRPLNHLLGTPTGHYGRAVVPAESPFELRQKADGNANDSPDSRPSKRSRRDITPPSKKGYAQNLFGATLSLSAVPLSSAPLRRSANSTYREQDTSTPQQQPGEDAKQGVNDETRHNGQLASGVRGPSSTTSVNSSSPKKAVAAPSVRTGEEAGGREDRISLQSSSKSLLWSHGGKAVPRPQSGGCESTEGIGRPTTSIGKSGLLTVAARRSEDQSRVQSEEMAQRILEFSKGTCHGESSTNAQASVPGSSRSQAIVLDEATSIESNPRQRFGEPRREVNEIAVPRHDSLGEAPKSSKSDGLPRTAVETQTAEPRPTGEDFEDAQRPPMEERTELRLKRRQKRGLLLLSEQRNRTKQPRSQGAPADESNPAGRDIERPVHSVAVEPSLGAACQTADATLSAQQGGSGPSSPAVSENSSEELDPLPPQPSPHQDSRRGSKVGNNADPSMLQVGTTTSTEPTERPVHPAGASKPDNDTGAEESDTEELPRSYRDRRMRLRAKASARAPDEPDDSGGLDEEALSEAQTEIPTLRPSRRTRKTECMDDQGSGRPRKKARKVDSEDSAKELPGAQVKPRLAKLSRKSVKSREIFGLVPSSSPPAILANAARAVVTEDRGGPSPVSGRPQPSIPKLAINSHEAAPPAVQQSDSDPHNRANGRLDETTRKDQATATAVLQSGHMTRRSVARPTPNDSAVGSGNDKEMVARASTSSGPQGITAPEKAVAQATSRPQGDTGERTPAAPATDSEVLQPRSNNEQPRLPEQPQAPMNNPADVGPNSRETKMNAMPRPDGPAAGSARPRIANPATRGRKAALESDAAGQVPRSILPPERAPALLEGTRGLHVRPEPAAAARESERPKRQMRYPGFTSAKGGGPWSREAHDLLESARPE
ncbi:hypothetical protein MYCTH_2310943 [Thermothelomyces thermophilus ATCC 42464]|uniref:5'-3' DNA helicase ZGRF1-like N-terminal domain-containing protein n=1 Tax=Thermothelomyces thermophilus (strain ATCC 42464 / BCRC 31852 / DSM 1799) TaxID=573729 RepID=G2QMA7_THET4|nr:uncharacterized protein MYCTH_2310943 [Thermothelomyces thermophilus ATCC 42464]AEO61087.1 hypothetical protein MYCTH_2310943 [Thermothelomyces thermophilus ATCC 42464]